MIELIISICFVNISFIYIISELLNKRNIISKIIIPYIILTIITVLTCNILYSPIRVMLLTISFFLFIKIVYCENIKKSILIPIFYQLGLMISELLFSIFSIIILKIDIEKSIMNPINSIIINIIISSINIFLFKIPVIKKFYRYMNNITNKINSKQLSFFMLGIIIIADILTTILYYKIEFIYLLIFNTMLTLFFFSIIIYNLNTQNKYINVYDKYNTTLNSLKESEDIIDKYRISNHENKNQLLTIRNMLSYKDKKIRKFIDQLIQYEAKDDDIVMTEVSKIPTGGLRGLLYSKFLYMKKHKIHYLLNISKNIKIADLINDFNDSDMLDICKIIGVYMDNAIEAVFDLKHKNINLDIYLDDEYLFFEISNYYEGIIELEKIEEKGYTTKGSSHGYGLSLTKKIITENKKLINEKKISKNVFTQVLKIKFSG